MSEIPETPSSKKAKQQRVKTFTSQLSFENVLVGYSKLGRSIDNWGRAPSKEQIEDLINACVTSKDVEEGEGYLLSLIMEEFKAATRDYEVEEEASHDSFLSLSDEVRMVLQSALTSDNLKKPLSTLKSLLVDEINKKSQEIKTEALNLFALTLKQTDTKEILDQLVFKFSVLEDKIADTKRDYSITLDDNKALKKRIKDLTEELKAEREKNVQNTANNFEGDLRRREEELKELQRKNDKLNGRIKELEDGQTKQKKEIQKLNGDISQHVAENRTLTEEIEGHTATIRDKEAQIEDLERELKDLKTRIDSLIAGKSTLEKSLALEKEENGKLAQRLEDSREQLSEYKERRGILKDKLGIDIDPEKVDEVEFQKQMAQVVKVFRDKESLEKELITVGQTIIMLKKTIENKDDEIRRLKEEIEALLRELKKLRDEADLSPLRDEIESLKHQLERKTDDLRIALENKARSDNLLADMQDEFADILQKVKELEAQHEADKDKYHQLERKYDKDTSQLRIRANSLENDYQELQKKLAETERELARVKELLDSIEYLQERLEIAKNQREGLKNDLIIANSNVQGMEDQVTLTRAEMNKLAAERDALKEKLASLEPQIPELKALIEKLEREKSGLESELAKLRNALDLSEHELSNVKYERDEIQAQRDNLAQKLAALQKIVDSLNEKNRSLNIETETLRAGKVTLVMQIEELEIQVNDLERTKDMLNNEKINLERELNSVKESYEDVRRDLDTAEYDAVKYKNQRDDLLVELSKATKHVEELKDVVAKQRVDIEPLSKLKSDLTRGKSRVEDLEQERVHLQKRMQDAERVASETLNKLDEAKRAYTNVSERLKDAEKTLKQAERERDEAINAEKTLKGQLESSVRKATNAEKDREHFKNLFNVEMNRATDLYGDIQKLIADHKRIQDDAERLKIRVPMLERENKLLLEQLAALRSELEAKESQKESYRRKAERSEAEAREMVFLKDKATEESRKLKDALFNEDDQKEKQISLLNDIRKKLDESIKKNADLKRENETLTSDRDYLQRKLTDLELNLGYLSQLKAEHELSKVQNTDFSEERVQLEAKFESLKIGLSERGLGWENKMNELQKQNETLAQDCASISQQNTVLRTQMDLVKTKVDEVQLTESRIESPIKENIQPSSSQDNAEKTKTESSRADGNVAQAGGSDLHVTSEEAERQKLVKQFVDGTAKKIEIGSGVSGNPDDSTKAFSSMFAGLQQGAPLGGSQQLEGLPIVQSTILANPNPGTTSGLLSNPGLGGSFLSGLNQGGLAGPIQGGSLGGGLLANPGLGGNFLAGLNQGGLLAPTQGGTELSQNLGQIPPMFGLQSLQPNQLQNIFAGQGGEGNLFSSQGNEPSLGEQDPKA